MITMNFWITFVEWRTTWKNFQVIILVIVEPPKSVFSLYTSKTNIFGELEYSKIFQRTIILCFEINYTFYCTLADCALYLVGRIPPYEKKVWNRSWIVNREIKVKTHKLFSLFSQIQKCAMMIIGMAPKKLENSIHCPKTWIISNYCDFLRKLV